MSNRKLKYIENSAPSCCDRFFAPDVRKMLLLFFVREAQFLLFIQFYCNA